MTPGLENLSITFEMTENYADTSPMVLHVALLFGLSSASHITLSKEKKVQTMDLSALPVAVGVAMTAIKARLLVSVT